MTSSPAQDDDLASLARLFGQPKATEPTPEPTPEVDAEQDEARRLARRLFAPGPGPGGPA